VRGLKARYSLLFDVDPSHRGLVQWISPGSTTSQALVFGTDSAEQSLALQSQGAWQTLKQYMVDGMWHIWIGYDHILFLLSLLLPAVLLAAPADNLRGAFIDVLKVVTAFTLAHSLTLTLASLSRFVRLFHIRGGPERQAVTQMVRELAIKVADPAQDVSSLSGGNQQKVVIGKALLTGPKVLLMDEPSRGIDVGAKADVFRTMRKLSRDGLGILFATSDLDEVMALSDRIAVMSNGKLTGMFDRAEATEAALVAASALGHGPAPHTENP